MQTVKLKVDTPPRFLQALNKTLRTVQSELEKLGIGTVTDSPEEKLFKAIYGAAAPNPCNEVMNKVALLALQDKPVFINGEEVDSMYAADSREPFIIRILWSDEAGDNWRVDLDLRDTRATRRAKMMRD